jgi:hypothetical protein
MIKSGEIDRAWIAHPYPYINSSSPIHSNFDMSTLERFTYAPTHQPQPGEIWTVAVPQPQDRLSLARYVTIVREPQIHDRRICTVMLLSRETQYLSNVDVLISPICSGLNGDVLAETWNVNHLSVDSLDKRVGNRLSRSIYDLLLSIGDGDPGGSIDPPSVDSVRALGLDFSQAAANYLFHQQERSWLQNLNPIVIAQANRLVELAAQIERESAYLVRIRTTLSEWFQLVVETPWQSAHQFERSMAISTRSLIDDAEFTQIISQLTTSDDRIRSDRLIKKLGSISSGNNDLLPAILQLIQTTQDDEILWAAIASLRRIDPHHPQLAIGQLQSIDLGIPLNFVVDLVPKAIDRVGILLQVYPDRSTPCLPANLKLILQDELGNSLKEVVAQAEDYCIQLKLSGVAREIFSVCLELDGVQSIVDFVI